MVSRTLPLLLSALALALALAAAAHAAPASPAAAPAVPTFAVGASTLSTGFVLEGVLQAQQQVSVSSQAAGRVLALAVKVGDRVKAGQVLARIDDRELQAGVAGGEAGVAQAQAALVQAEQNAQRTRDLRAQGFLSAAALDGATAQLKAAQAALQQAQAGRSQAALARGHATVTAPFDGIVLATAVDAGDLATPGRPLLTLYAPGRLRAVVQLPASRSAAARASSRVDVTLPDGRQLQPTQRTELPGTDAVSQTVEWRLDLPTVNPAAPGSAPALQPGQPVRVGFSGFLGFSGAPAGSAPVAGAATLVIPTSAVLVRGELTAVYAVDTAAGASRFVLKAVRLGAAQGSQVPVLAGLKAGERIATDPVRAGLAGATPAAR
jgi:RND family efflux transporter MFP subunit